MTLQAAPTSDEDIKSTKKYDEKREAEWARMVVGGTDLGGNKITKIYSKGDEYLIYEIPAETEAESFRVAIYTVVESDPENLIKRFEAIKEDLVSFRSILFKGVHDPSFKHQAANAISTALRGDTEKSKLIFKDISDRVKNEYKQIQAGRISYFSGSLAVASFLALLSVTLYLFRTTIFVQNIAGLKHIVYAASFSTLGGVLSVSINIRKIEFERDWAQLSFFIYGMQRALISGLCGLFAYALIKGEFIFSLILKAENPMLAILAICAAAGFSETLIPNALRKIESEKP